MFNNQQRIKPRVLQVLVSAFLILSSYLAQATPPQGDGGGSTSGPIDGGAVGLLVAAAVYGYKQSKNKIGAAKATEVVEVTADESI